MCTHTQLYAEEPQTSVGKFSKEEKRTLYTTKGFCFHAGYMGLSIPEHLCCYQPDFPAVTDPRLKLIKQEKSMCWFIEVKVLEFADFT
jgi:hypothetical protein